MDNVSKALELFGRKCGCSQSVLGGFCDDLGLDEDVAMKISAGFAGGMKMAGTCGAVTGAFMVLGLSLAGDECRTPEARALLAVHIREFAARFRTRNGSITCRTILDCDISTPDGFKQALESNLFTTKCRSLVQDAAEILRDMLAESASGC